MKQELVGIYDITAQQLIDIRFVPTAKVAVRDCDGLVNDPQMRTNIAKFPAEFELKSLGVIDTETCTIYQSQSVGDGAYESLIKTVVNMLSLKNETQSTIKADDLPQK